MAKVNAETAKQNEVLRQQIARNTFLGNVASLAERAKKSGAPDAMVTDCEQLAAKVALWGASGEYGKAKK